MYNFSVVQDRFEVLTILMHEYNAKIKQKYVKYFKELSKTLLMDFFSDSQQMCEVREGRVRERWNIPGFEDDFHLYLCRLTEDQL